MTTKTKTTNPPAPNHHMVVVRLPPMVPHHSNTEAHLNHTEARLNHMALHISSHTGSRHKVNTRPVSRQAMVAPVAPVVPPLLVHVLQAHMVALAALLLLARAPMVRLSRMANLQVGTHHRVKVDTRHRRLVGSIRMHHHHRPHIRQITSMVHLRHPHRGKPFWNCRTGLYRLSFSYDNDK